MQSETRLHLRCSLVKLRLALAASLAVWAAALVPGIAPASGATANVTFSGSLAASHAVRPLPLEPMRQTASDFGLSNKGPRRDDDSPALTAHDADRTVDDADDDDDDDDPSATVVEIAIPARSSHRTERSQSPTLPASPLVHLVATPVRC